MSKKPGKKTDVISEEMWGAIEDKVLEKLDTAKLLILITQIKSRHADLVYEVGEAEKELKEVELFDVESYSLQRKTEEIGDNFKKTIKNLENEKSKYDALLKKLNEEKMKEISVIKKKYSEEIAKKDKEIEELLEKFTDISGFPEREVHYLEEIASLEKKFKELEEIHSEEIKKTEKMFVNQRDKNEKDYQLKIDEINKNAHELAEQEAFISKKLEKQNNKINNQLTLQKTETEHIKMDHFQIAKDNLAMKQKITTNNAILKDFKNINYKQTMKLKKLNEKIDYLKKYISTEVVKFTKELEISKSSNAKSIYDAEYQIKYLREQIKIKSKEMKTLKSLVQMILDQRSDLEEFFLEAWDQVSKEILETKKEEIPLNLPDISKSSKSTVSNSENKEKKERRVRIKELSLEDRDKIMRIMFSKINSGVKPKPWRKIYEIRENSDVKYDMDEEENKINIDSKTNQFSSFEN